MIEFDSLWGGSTKFFRSIKLLESLSFILLFDRFFLPLCIDSWKYFVLVEESEARLELRHHRITTLALDASVSAFTTNCLTNHWAFSSYVWNIIWINSWINVWEIFNSILHFYHSLLCALHFMLVCISELGRERW